MAAKRRIIVKYDGALTGLTWYCQRIGKAVMSSSTHITGATEFPSERKAKDFAAQWNKLQPRCKLEIVDLETNETIR